MDKKTHIISIKLFVLSMLLILFFTTGFSVYSQESLNDTTKVKKPEVVHSPRRATIYSAVLPGLGQLYNRKYWKVPIVYGGFITLGYFINYNNGVYTTYKQAYADILDNDPNTKSYEKLKVPPSFLQPDKISQLTERLRGAKDQWRRYRDMVVIGTAVFYAVNIIDASVDANFFNFDISDDLTINWAPGPVMCLDNKSIGISCIFTF